MGTRLHEIWATAALGELELGLGDAARAVALFEHQQRLLDDLMITDPDLSPAAELVEGYLTIGRHGDALFLSPKTVEYHLRHVYQRLGIPLP